MPSVNNDLFDQVYANNNRRFTANGTEVRIQIDREVALASDSKALLDHLDVLLCAGQLPTAQRTAIATHLDSLPTDQEGTEQRALDAIYCIVGCGGGRSGPHHDLDTAWLDQPGGSPDRARSLVCVFLAGGADSFDTEELEAATQPNEANEVGMDDVAGNDLGVQLRQVARLIKSRDQLGMPRQVFFVRLGGWDTHRIQQQIFPPLLSVLDDALGWSRLRVGWGSRG